MKKVSYNFLIFLCISQKVWALDFEDGVFPEFATSSRALAMGNAFIATVDDSSAVFYNPAGLGSVKYKHLHLSNFSMETNNGGIHASTSSSAFEVFSKGPKLFSVNGMKTVLKDFPGILAHSKLHILPNFTARYFSAGFLFAKRSRGFVNSETAVTGFEFADRQDTGPYGALNISLFGGTIKAGISFLLLNRRELIGVADPTDSADISSSLYKNGTALIATSGARITLPIALLPTFAATVHNTLNQTFTATSSAGAPTDIPMSIDAGFSINPQLGTRTKLRLEVNLKDITQAYPDTSVGRKLLIGSEFQFVSVYFLRLGYGDGLGSAGIGVRSKKVEFDITTYGVNTTTTTFSDKADRRFAFSFSSGF